ncbi:MAG: pyridoxal phosphate-dependent aminotransferase [Candidatus Gracilibacteria bacterium]|nr:pyridoxal phosphate-dependent aminotransferase [Candidatus Gracilibacteria bacterium]
MKPLASAMTRLGTEKAFAVSHMANELLRTGQLDKVVSLAVGEPDFDTPMHIREAAIEGLKKGETHYSPTIGRRDAREIVADYVNKNRGINVDPDDIIITPGGKPIMAFAIQAIVDPGDEVILFNPGYPIYESMVDYLGAKKVWVNLNEENDFVFDIKELEAAITDKTKMIVLNSPQNPTGGVIDKKTMDKLVELVLKHDLYVLTDEIYWRIVYEGEFISPISYPGMLERTILLDGWSKTYAMTGWRLGYAVIANKDIRHYFDYLMTNYVSNTCMFAQIGAMAALTGPQDEAESMVKEFKERRDLIHAEINKIEGVSARLPKGAFYIMMNIKNFGIPAVEFGERMLKEQGVAGTAGTYFGSNGEGYIRFSYAASKEKIKDGMERVERFVKSL